MNRGKQKQVLTPGQNEKCYLAGAMDTRDGHLTWVGSDKKNSGLFIDLLRALDRQYPRAKRIHVILGTTTRFTKANRRTQPLSSLPDGYSFTSFRHIVQTIIGLNESGRIYMTMSRATINAVASLTLFRKSFSTYVTGISTAHNPTAGKSRDVPVTFSKSRTVI
jgi:hypothetical protein